MYTHTGILCTGLVYETQYPSQFWFLRLIMILSRATYYNPNQFECIQLQVLLFPKLLTNSFFALHVYIFSSCHYHIPALAWDRLFLYLIIVIYLISHSTRCFFSFPTKTASSAKYFVKCFRSLLLHYISIQYYYVRT